MEHDRSTINSRIVIVTATAWLGDDTMVGARIILIECKASHVTAVQHDPAAYPCCWALAPMLAVDGIKSIAPNKAVLVWAAISKGLIKHRRPI